MSCLWADAPRIRVPHLRDGFIVDKVGIREANRSPLPATTSTSASASIAATASHHPKSGCPISRRFHKVGIREANRFLPRFLGLEEPGRPSPADCRQCQRSVQLWTSIWNIGQPSPESGSQVIEIIGSNPAGFGQQTCLSSRGKYFPSRPASKQLCAVVSSINRGTTETR
jgi:hypothetical protein